MRRLLTVLLAYCVAAIVGAAIFFTAFPLGPGAKGFLIGIYFFVTAFGAVLAAPIALPLILATEIRGEAKLWWFVLAGVLAGLLVFGLLISDGGWQALAISMATFPIAAVTYWLIAWKRFAPIQPKAPDK